MSTAIILGRGSDIAMNIEARLLADGWTILGTHREDCDFSSLESIDKTRILREPWDLLLCAVGTLAPIGQFSAIHPDEWHESVVVNAIGPLRMLHHLLPNRAPNSAAVFFSGTNPAKTNPGYSAYSSSKALLMRAVEEINAELDIRVFAIAPGFIRTKIHAGHDVSARRDGTTHEQIYDCLKDCLSRPKRDIGGKIVHVPIWHQLFRVLN